MLYPIMTQSRTVTDLSGVWKFKLDDGDGFHEKWYERPLADPDTMPVPASYNDMKENAAYRDHYGWAFYQRTFRFPKALKRERVMLRFDAVTHAAVVWLNGTEITRHKGGFLPFEVQINPYLAEDVNLLTVAVDNRIDHATLPVGSEKHGGSVLVGGKTTNVEQVNLRNMPNFDFFNYCGITRPVRIYTTPEIYVEDISLDCSVEGTDAVIRYAVAAGKAEGAACEDVGASEQKPVGAAGRMMCEDADKAKQKRVDAGVPEEAEPGQKAPDIHVELRDREGRVAASAEGASGELAVRDVHLWEPLAPYLYEFCVTCKEDSYSLPYGVRTVEVNGGQFLINGKPFYFKGYGKHEDTFPAGRGLNIPMNCKDISLMKWQGANSFRTSHYPYSEEMMRLCDEEGIVVIDEVPAVGLHLNFGGGAEFRNGEQVHTFDPEEKGGLRTKSHHRDVIRDLIARDKNHACVVMWSIANEPDNTDEGAYDYFKPLFDLARSSDPQKRPCTMVCMQVEDNTKDCSIRLSDVICLNRYYGWYVMGGDLDTAEILMREEMKFWEELGKPFMFTEYGADTVAGFHDTVPVMFTEEYQIEYYRMNHKVMDVLKHFIGEQVWNFADFATSQGIMRVQGNKKGIFTRDRKPKQAAYYLKERWKR